MSSIGLPDLLSIIQSTVLICALSVTLSRLQAQAQKVNLETATLGSLEEKQQHLNEIVIEDPTLLKVIANIPSLQYTKEEATAWFTISMCAYAFRMKERGILSGNEWDGWLLWMKNVFRYGTLGKYWKETGYESWFEPSFRDFVNMELVTPKS